MMPDDIFDALQAPQKRKIEDFDGHFEPLIPFDQFNTPAIPSSLLPPVIGDFVENLSEVLSIPPEMPLMAALGIVSTALSKKFVVSPKPDWREPVNIYTLTAMMPASNKSQTLKYLRKPIDEWEEREGVRIAPQRQEALTELKMLTTEQQKHYGVIKAKKAKQADIESAKDAIKALDDKIRVQKDALPVIPQVYTTDATPEAIADLLQEQGGRFGIISDEGGITEVLAGLYNNGNANIDIFLKGIDGGATRIKRKEKDLRLNPYLSVILLIQPQVLSNMADKRAFTGNGMLERFLYALPVSNVGYREFAESQIDEMAETRYSNLVFNLLSLPTPESPYVLTLETPAQKAFYAFRKEIERELRPDGKLHICMAWGGKLAGYTLRLAGLLHVIEHNNPDHLIIKAGTMDKAMRLARLLMEHALAAFGLMGTDQESKDGKELYEWIITQGTDRLNKSEIINAMRNRKMGKKDRLSKAIESLVYRHILSLPHSDQSTKKPTEVYFINPKIHEA